jgi:uncharacterized membrane protein YjjP (DUF1212 family)
VSPPDLALLATGLAGFGLRLAGLALGGLLRPDHPLIGWASAVSIATLAAFVSLALVAPAGLLATIPGAARAAAVAAGAVVYLLGGRRLLPAMLAALAALVAARLVTG